VSNPLRILATRGDLVESSHDVTVAVTDRQGRLLAWSEDPELLTFWRSAAKPFQALPLLEDGAASRFDLGTEELALACASHSSEPAHLEITDRFLAKIGCTEADLACGPHPPLGPNVAERVLREGLRPTPRWSNCSGKHSGMLALAKHHGWSTKGYEGKDHPVQRRIIEGVLQWTGAEGVAEATGLSLTVRLGNRLHLAVDGCQAVCFGLPLSGMARAYAALGDGATPELATLRDAMLARPELVAGTGRSCTDVMRALPGKVVVKLGADGVYCGALVGTGLGFALKVRDGEMRSLPVALLAVLDQLAIHLGWETRWDRLVPQHGSFEIKNTRRTVTGRVQARGGLQFL
jgi:L-asparaginase II